MRVSSCETESRRVMCRGVLGMAGYEAAAWSGEVS